MSEEQRPSSGLRGRNTRRGGNANASSKAADAAAEAADNAAGPDGEDGTEEGAAWKVEMESIMGGTHPDLIKALEPHDQKMKATIAQADRVRQLQISNINSLFECEKKQSEDENKAHLELFRSRLIDTIEEKQKKAARQREAGSGSRGESKQPADKRKRVEVTGSCLPPSYALKADELKADLEEITTNVDHYSVRSAAAASDELRSSSSADAWFDRGRQVLHCGSQTFERNQHVFVYAQGQRVDDQWSLAAMNAVEVTLRDAEGSKLKVTLAQLRNGRYAFRPAPTGFA